MILVAECWGNSVFQNVLLIIKGVLSAYSLAFYMIADDKSIGVMDKIKKSKGMMDG